jgi:hypothetical protein
MKKIILKIFFLFFTTSIILFILNFTSDKLIRNNFFYKINKDANILILGHSHLEYDLNDSLINNSVNFSQGGDSYFYIYFKFKKIIESNTRINTLILAISNNMFSDDIDDIWIFEKNHLEYKYPKYSNLISYTDKWLLIKKEPISFSIASIYALKAKINLIISGNNNLIKKFEWGGYKYSSKNELESFNQKNELNISYNKSHNLKATSNIYFLDKIVDFANKNKIKLILLRSPLHHFYNREYESILNQFISKNPEKFEYWDYADYFIKDQFYIDYSHLNYKGATIFSKIINTRINSN